MKIKIGERLVGKGEPCFIIAEAGSNHNGSLENAKKLIDAAADAKADAIKFQVFKTEKLYVGNAGAADYLKNGKSINHIIKEMEFPEEWLEELPEYCKKKGILFLASAFDEESMDRLDEYVAAHKIASYEANHIPLIKHAAGKKKPIIISSGASTMEEIREAVGACKDAGVCIMQCTAKYPAPPNTLNLRVISSLEKEFGVPVGFSDHSRQAFVAPLGAVALGASIIEKHFTLDNQMPGVDHKFAIEPKELKLLVEYIRELEEALGSGEKGVLPEEKELYLFAKRAVHAIGNIGEGEEFTKENIAVLRPGKTKRGIAPKFYEKILGKNAKRKIEKWEGINEGDF